MPGTRSSRVREAAPAGGRRHCHHFADEPREAWTGRRQGARARGCSRPRGAGAPPHGCGRPRARARSCRACTAPRPLLSWPTVRHALTARPNLPRVCPRLPGPSGARRAEGWGAEVNPQRRPRPGREAGREGGRGGPCRGGPAGAAARLSPLLTVHPPGSRLASCGPAFRPPAHWTPRPVAPPRPARPQHGRPSQDSEGGPWAGWRTQPHAEERRGSQARGHRSPGCPWVGRVRTVPQTRRGAVPARGSRPAPSTCR